MNLLALSVTAALALPAQAVTPVAKHAAETAEAARIKALEQKLDQSLSVIEQLKTRLAELERRAAPAAAPVAPAPVVAAKAVPDPRVEQLEADVRNLAAAAASSKPADTGVPFHGFLDVGYQSLSKQSDGKRSGATLGTFDVYLTPQLGSNVRSLIELAFEYGPDGGLGIDLERVQIGYAFSDELVLWGGRFHTPFGYWNTAFHHGAQLQTSITRPRFIAFEDQGGVLPSHTVGGWATGKTPTSFGKVSYDLYAGNGNRIQDGVLDYNAFGDDNGSPIVGFNVGVSPQGFSGLTVGLHGFQQKVSGSNAAGTLTGSVQSRVLGAYGYWEGDSFELIASTTASATATGPQADCVAPRRLRSSRAATTWSTA
jgi:hypothetical protein